MGAARHRVLDLWPLFVQTGMVEDMQATSGERLGINLTPEDVAATLLTAVSQARSKPAGGRVRNPMSPSAPRPGW